MKVKRISAIDSVTLATGVSWLDISTEEDDMGFTTHEIRLDAGASYTMEQVANCNNVYYCLEGSCEIILSRSLKYNIKKKSVLAVPEGMSPEIKSGDSFERTRLVVFLISSGSDTAKLEPKCKSFEDMLGTPCDVEWGNGRSKRYLTKADGYGITVTNTYGYANVKSPLQYRNHHELCYFYQGSINYIWDNGNQHTGIRQERVEEGDGIVLMLDKHDCHTMQTLDLPCEGVCAFFPALNGTETHKLDEDGHSAY